MKKTIAGLILLLLLAGIVFAASEDSARSITLPAIKTELKAGDGKDKTEAYCSVCHSTDYITMQPKLQRSQWSATVNKMIKVFGAPISEDDAKTIVTYLVKNYGTGN